MDESCLVCRWNAFQRDLKHNTVRNSKSRNLQLITVFWLLKKLLVFVAGWTYEPLVSKGLLAFRTSILNNLKCKLRPCRITNHSDGQLSSSRFLCLEVWSSSKKLILHSIPKQLEMETDGRRKFEQTLEWINETSGYACAKNFVKPMRRVQKQLPH